MKLSVLASAALILASAPAFAGDVAKGEKVFKKCKSCHMVGENAKKKVGPVLNGIFGAAAGANEEFGKKYSKVMKKAGEEGLVWTEETMTAFLKDPKGNMKGTKMSFKGLKKDKDLENVIAYLLQFSPEYTPMEKTDG